jgi:hypothetical protein
MEGKATLVTHRSCRFAMGLLLLALAGPASLRAVAADTTDPRAALRNMDPAPWEGDASAGAARERDGRVPETDPPAWFYRGTPYGSESLVQPLRLVLNGGFGILQLDNRDKRLGKIAYGTGIDNVWMNIRDPFKAIRETGGWSDFLEREVLPLSVNSNKAQFWPNYTQHLIGGGMSYRMYVEWFRHHGWRHPKWMSGATVVMHHLVNETVENDGFRGWRTDPVADMWIFDPLGVVLFSHDGVARFFGETMHMADWSYQPAIDPADGALINNGQNFAMKYDLPWSERWQLFYHYETHAEIGFTRRLNRQDSFSFGAGLRAGELIELDDGFRTVDLAASAGLFYDRNNSLLASLTMAKTKEYRFRVNVYPGVLRFGPVSPGLFFADRRKRGLVFGVTFDFLPMLPAGLAGDFH